MAKITKTFKQQESNDTIDNTFEVTLDPTDISYPVEVPPSELGMHLQEVGSEGVIKRIECVKRFNKKPFKSPVVDIKAGETRIYAGFIDEIEVTSQKDGKKFSTYGTIGEITQPKDLHKNIRNDLDSICKKLIKNK